MQILDDRATDHVTANMLLVSMIMLSFTVCIMLITDA